MIFFRQHIKVTSDPKDYIAVGDMYKYAQSFSYDLHEKSISMSKLYKFFRSKGLEPKQKRNNYNKIRCFEGLRYSELSDEDVTF